MAKNKKNVGNKNRGEQKKIKKAGIFKNKNFILGSILSVVLVIIVVLAVTNPFFIPPSGIESNKYYKISEYDLINGNKYAVYYVSWYGCPIGAADSWSLYYAMNSTENIYKDVQLHTSSSTDIFADNPGLIFKDNITFNYKSKVITFYPLYLYNQTLTGTVNNKTISGSKIAYGFSIINKTFPARVASEFYKYRGNITYDEHIETTMIITGPRGGYIYQGLLYNPENNIGTGNENAWAPDSPAHVMSNLNGINAIKSSGNQFLGYIIKA